MALCAAHSLASGAAHGAERYAIPIEVKCCDLWGALQGSMINAHSQGTFQVLPGRRAHDITFTTCGPDLLARQNPDVTGALGCDMLIVEKQSV